MTEVNILHLRQPSATRACDDVQREEGEWPRVKKRLTPAVPKHHLEQRADRGKCNDFVGASPPAHSPLS